MDLSYFGFEGMTTITNIHPAFVHFPIALLPTAFLLYFIGILWEHSRLRRGARMVLLLAALSTVIAVITGMMAEGTFPHGEELHRMIETHEMLGLITMGLTMLLSAWCLVERQDAIPKQRYVFLATLGLTALLALQNGDIGSRMVYEHGAAVQVQSESTTRVEPAPAESGGHDHAGHSH